MKRQRNMESLNNSNRKAAKNEGTCSGAGATVTVPKKKAKRATAKVEEEANSGAVVVESLPGLEELQWLASAVHEQMTWGHIWLPCWDVEYLSENYNALFSDVAWDDDIWNLRDIKEAPN